MPVEHTGSQPGSTRAGLQIQISKLLLASVVAAIASSVAMIVAAVMILQAPLPPPPAPGSPPPPPPVAPIVLITVITGLFVVSWTSLAVLLARDQILRRLREMAGGAGGSDELVATLRADLAAFEERMAALTAEYGEQRETDGYVNGMRVATQKPLPQKPSPQAEVRPLHRVPPKA